MSKPAIKRLEQYCRSYQFNDVGLSPLQNLELFCDSFQFDAVGLDERKRKEKEKKIEERKRKYEEKRKEKKKQQREKKKQEQEKKWREEVQKRRENEIQKRQANEYQRRTRLAALKTSIRQFEKTGILPERDDSYLANLCEEKKKQDRKESKRQERNKQREEKRKQKETRAGKKCWKEENQRELRLKKLQQEMGDPTWQWKHGFEDAENKRKEAFKKGEFLKVSFYREVQQQCLTILKRYKHGNTSDVMSDESKDKLDFSPLTECVGNDVSDEIKDNLDFSPVSAITSKP